MLKPGEQIAERFEVESLLGEGGLAHVYRVRHKNLGTIHALKLLTMSHPSLVERLLQEGRIQAQIRHPNIVGVTDVIDVNGQPALLLEFVDCETLEASLARRGKWAVDEALDMFAAVLGGVVSAHAAGVLHRDLKPANILLARTPDGVVPKVADFGIAKIAQQESSNPGITRAGAAMGTPGYMAPEQAEDATSVDVRADIFSLGTILYETIAGVRAFPSKSMRETLNAMASGTFVPLSTAVPECPRHVSDAVQRSLDPVPEQRFPDCESFARALFVDDPMRLAAVLGSRVTPPPLPPSMWGRGTAWASTGPGTSPSPVRPAEPTLAAGVSGTDTGLPVQTLPAESFAPRGLSERSALLIGLGVGGGLAVLVLLAVSLWLDRGDPPPASEPAAPVVAPATPSSEGTSSSNQPAAAAVSGQPAVVAPSPAVGVAPRPAAPSTARRTSPEATAVVKEEAPPSELAAPGTPAAPAPEPEAPPSEEPEAGTSVGDIPTVDEVLSAEVAPTVSEIPDLVGTWSGDPWTITLLEQSGADVAGFIYRDGPGSRISITGTYDAEKRSLTLVDSSDTHWVLSGSITGKSFKGSYTQGQGKVRSPFTAKKVR